MKLPCMNIWGSSGEDFNAVLGKVHYKSPCWPTLETPFCPFCLAKIGHKWLFISTSNADTAVQHAVLARQCWEWESQLFKFIPQALSPLLDTPPPSFINELIHVPSPVLVCLCISWGSLGSTAVVSPVVMAEVILVVTQPAHQSSSDDCWRKAQEGLMLLILGYRRVDFITPHTNNQSPIQK